MHYVELTTLLLYGVSVLFIFLLWLFLYTEDGLVFLTIPFPTLWILPAIRWLQISHSFLYNPNPPFCFDFASLLSDSNFWFFIFMTFVSLCLIFPIKCTHFHFYLSPFHCLYISMMCINNAVACKKKCSTRIHNRCELTKVTAERRKVELLTKI